MSEKKIESFAEFWPYYVSEHSNPTCRNLHYLGTTLTLATVAAALATGNYALFAAVPVVGYGPAWIGHYVFEKNRPATFSYPLWSIAADFKMYGYFLTGRMGAEIDKHARSAA